VKTSNRLGYLYTRIHKQAVGTMSLDVEFVNEAYIGTVQCGLVSFGLVWFIPVASTWSIRHP
jgi:hypothetical protein